MSRNWASHTKKIVDEIEGRFVLPVPCTTYKGHGVVPSGRDGEPFGIDVWIAPYGKRANQTQEALGDAIQKWLEANWDRLGIHYVIWWGWMAYRPGQWSVYDPGTYNNPLASPAPETVYHRDHLHIQVTEENRYTPPKDQGPVSKFMPSVPVKWYQAHSDNFTVGRSRAIDRVVLHVTGGSFNSAVNTFQNPANQVSTHYLIRSSDGHVGQLVSELNTAWHAGSWDMNQRSIGVEHEAVKDQTGYLTSAMLNSSVELVADICKRHHISPDGLHIIFHREASNTECPTPFWDKGRYVQLVREKMVPAPTPPADPNDSLFGPVRFSKEQAVAATQRIYPDANMGRVRAAARNIYALKDAAYISPDRRFAQFLLETGAGKYGGDSVWPNMAGIKKGPKERGGTVEDEPIDFLVPRNAFAGALIQANHWCAYTKTPLPRDAHPVHERYWVAKSVTESKPAVTRISQTGGGVWATDPGYSKKWRDLMDRLAAHPTVKEAKVGEEKINEQRYLDYLEDKYGSEPQNQSVEAGSHGPSNKEPQNETTPINAKVPAAAVGGGVGVPLTAILIYILERLPIVGDIPIEIEAAVTAVMVASLAAIAGYYTRAN